MDKIAIGSPIFAADGLRAGEVDRIILDPQTGQITGIVARAAHHLARDVVMPARIIQNWDREAVWLKLGVLELERLPDFAEADYVAPGANEMVTGNYRPSEVLLEVVRAARSPASGLAKGQDVICRDGRCGTVEEVRVDPVTRKVVSFRLKRAGALTRDVVVPVEWVLGARGRRIEIDCNVRQLEELLPPAEEMRSRGAS